MDGENLDIIEMENGEKAPLEDTALKTYRQLTKRTYLGIGYVHTFKNNSTQELVYVPCTQAEFEELTDGSGAPTLADHTWVSSGGGTKKVDTPNSMLGEDEYCIDGSEVYVNLKNEEAANRHQYFTTADINVNGSLAENVIIKK